jgi:ABC-2 type transport system ATP-binding protein
MLVEIKNIYKQFERPALSDISASFSKGKIIGIVGPDGAGKTTLIRLMAGLLKPTQGSVTIEGHDTILESEKVHFLIGYMPQRFGLYEDLTVQQNLNLYADLAGTSGDERKQAFEKLLKFTGLAPFTDRLARALSGGMKQKLGLACALIKKPALLLLDEPSVGVDPVSRRELWSMVHDLIQEGISVVWSTAYLDEAQQCDTVLLLSEGRLCFFGDPKELTQRVEGRTFKVVDIEGDKRALLFQVLKNDNVMDGVIQGQDLRIVLRKGGSPPPHLHVEATAPRFEDAFIDILGGGPGGSSELADKTPPMQNGVIHVIEAQELTKQFGSFTAAENITLEVKKGEIFGLLGPNGAGKTTTFKMLCGLLRPTSGKAFVNGVDLLNAPAEARSHIGYMAQRFSLYGTLSVAQNLAFFAGIYNHTQKVGIDEMVETFDLQPYLNTAAELLPLGFKQRLALACANMHHPAVLFLDEPTSGVDPITRREFWNHINGLVGKGVTIMVTTHFMDEAEYCDRIALIYRGKIINMDTPSALKSKVISIKNPTLEDAFIQMIEAYDRR